MTTPPPAFAVADTSALLAVFNARDRNHRAAREVLGLPRTLVISPLCLAELGYLQTRQTGERAALGAVRHLAALARLGRAQIVDVNGDLPAEALRTTYEGHGGGSRAAAIALAGRRHTGGLNTDSSVTELAFDDCRMSAAHRVGQLSTGHFFFRCAGDELVGPSQELRRTLTGGEGGSAQVQFTSQVAFSVGALDLSINSPLAEPAAHLASDGHVPLSLQSGQQRFQADAGRVRVEYQVQGPCFGGHRLRQRLRPGPTRARKAGSPVRCCPGTTRDGQPQPLG
ncbi:PIN domain-containing protein [Streptomyces sp. Ac-502]|uniref:PIN domain-containing protein n=1 Tax=Streptomyces sp. Ac-502 TaxID=3342801 RepID=UPI0038622F59